MSLSEMVGMPAFNIRHIIVHATLDLFLDATFGSNMKMKDKIMYREVMAE